jgi:hypothetical protein
MMLTCETAEGRQVFSTPSDSDSIRTPDGRLVSGRSMGQETQDVYQMRILQEIITGQQPYTGTFGLQTSRGGRGDETADLITNLIGVNALSRREIRNVLTIIRIAFARPDNIAPGLNYPARSFRLLGHLADLTDDSSLQRQITETLEYLQTR